MRRSWPCDAREAVSATERAGRSRCVRGRSERERDLTPCPPKTRPARSSSRRRGAPPGSAGRSPSSGPVQRLRSARTASGAATRPPPPRPWRRSKGVRKKAKPAATPPTVWAQACLGWAHRVAHVDAERLFKLLASVRPDTAYTGPRSAGVSYRATSRLVSTGGHCTQTGH